MKSFIAFFSEMTFDKSALLLITPILTAIMSIKAALFGLVILIFIDFITGIRKTHYQRNISFNPLKNIFWKSIKSYLLRQTWRKSYEYGLGIIVIIVFETMIFNEQLSITLLNKSFTFSELLIIIPAVIEVWSIFENFEAVSGKNLLKRAHLLLPDFLVNIFNKKKES